MTDLITRRREAKELTFNLFWEVAEHLNVEADGRLRQLTAARAWESAAVVWSRSSTSTPPQRMSTRPNPSPPVPTRGGADEQAS